MNVDSDIPHFGILPEGMKIRSQGFDTVKLAQDNLAPPIESELTKRGWRRIHNRFVNEARSTGEPRLTLAPSNSWKYKRHRQAAVYSGSWSLWVEVSFGSWLFPSNLVLSDQNRISTGLSNLNEYVRDKAGFEFNAERARVSRFDVAQDFAVGGDALTMIIERFKNKTFPKYKSDTFDTGVTFFNCPSDKPPDKSDRTKQFRVYSKEDEFRQSGKSNELIAQSHGLIRLEVQSRGRAVWTLRNKLGLPNSAADVLSNRSVESVLQHAWSFFKIEHLLGGYGFDAVDFRTTVFKNHTATTALALMKWYELRTVNHPLVMQLPAHTRRRLDEHARRAGAPF